MSHKPKSIFGPLLLIAIGAIWLLTKSGTIPTANLWALTRIWPYLLIAAGLGLILRSYWEYTNILLDIVIIGGAVIAIVYAPQLGWDNPSMTGVFHDGDFYFGPGDRGSGNMITSSREVYGFHAIELDYPAKVFIKQGSSESVKIEAEDNLMPLLKTEVRNGRLKIFYRKSGEKHVNPTETVVINITVKQLDEVNFSSAGELILEDIKTDKLEVSLNGAGTLDLRDVEAESLQVSLSGAGSMSASGKVDELDVNISGFGDFKGEDLQSQTAVVSISGAGSATVWVEDKLDAEISGAGSVNYYGSPSVTKQIGGLGTVNKSGDK
jgi:hypothetical protein